MKTKVIDRKNYVLYIDKTKNRIYFELHNKRWELEDANLLLLDWKTAITQVQHDFTVLSDIRHLKIQSPKLDKLHEEAQKYVAENGLLKLARVLSEDDIVNLQFSRIAERSSIPNNVFRTLEEAEEYLENITNEAKKISKP